VNYYTLSDENGEAIMLVRLDWPDVQEYVTPKMPLWQKNPDLARLAFDSVGKTCSYRKAQRLARDWGATFP
jgi:hypothetical protein